ncbi:LacI family transcriptional regulator [Pseudomaricurvus alkylphenolicus]|uniref:LacI family DNA-binding transcriptional regulator n=1 Tax=Pseudomaricurvus alkylphenolicus TaxID=1306991 RepID=UPI0014205F37|nr:LacI family DNA-binding transcriptional regulator [Pseudomaricurvus alkylphenolicus]NIB42383.1 LacI family transcriptional regulator [Pseudomaricurvus alkylphenolicus]
MARPTIKDVSKLAGVSIATVSNVVNGHPNVTDSTRSKVEDAIHKLGYQANRAARSLPAGQTGLLGYRMPDGKRLNVSLDTFLHQIVEHAGAIGLEVLLFAPRPGQTEQEAYSEVLIRGGVDGFVLSGIDYHDPVVKYLLERKVPFAAFGRADEYPGAAWVDVDGAEGLRLATEHLIESGRKNVAFIGWPAGSLTGDERYRGWQQAMLAAGRDIDNATVLRVLDGYEIGISLTRQLLDSGVDAVACVSDTLALGVMAGLRRLDLVPGEEMAVVGFDNVSAGELVEPGLTSLDQPMADVASELVGRLSRILRGENPGQGLLLPPRLVVRGSTSIPV